MFERSLLNVHSGGLQKYFAAGPARVPELGRVNCPSAMTEKIMLRGAQCPPYKGPPAIIFFVSLMTSFLYHFGQWVRANGRSLLGNEFINSSALFTCKRGLMTVRELQSAARPWSCQSGEPDVCLMSSASEGPAPSFVHTLARPYGSNETELPLSQEYSAMVT